VDNNKILLITPPDVIHNQNRTCMVIYPSIKIKQELEKILATAVVPLNVYMYTQDDEHQDIDWLLTTAKFCDTVILDVDNCPPNVKALASYLISLPNTYWLTSEDIYCYSKLSYNRIYGLDTLATQIGGKIEKVSQT